MPNTTKIFFVTIILLLILASILVGLVDKREKTIEQLKLELVVSDSIRCQQALTIDSLLCPIEVAPIGRHFLVTYHAKIDNGENCRWSMGYATLTVSNGGFPTDSYIRQLGAEKSGTSAKNIVILSVQEFSKKDMEEFVQ